ncbi:MAG TPA: translation initiation factor IF-3 [Candidatus Marinimicrobia bacterium]|nr:translation initiation factor IF-3 [Candidatus Neomarinimicrobiota bacterium]HJM84635.1 translation initiation factor IF-3 [Candidatus Neomarinimicrobiota bacterium]
MAKDKNDPRINEEIRVPRVRLIDEEGNQAGVVTIKDAIYKAEQAGLDLVEIAQKVDPPVCKILDFGKYRYEIQKQKKINKKKQHVVQLKEIRIRPNTGDHDLLTKLKKAQKFIESGAKLKVTVMFRGREMSRKEAGMDLLKRVTGILEDVAKIDKAASLEGRRMSIILSPR